MKHIFTLVLVVLSGTAFAQEELFKVLVNKGNNTSAAKAIVTGSKIYKGEAITVSPGGYLGLIYKNGKSLEVKIAGNYKTEDLEKQALATSGSFSKKYADLVLSEMTKSRKAITDDYRSNMEVAGSVERTLNNTVVISPRKTYLLGNKVKITWLTDANTTKGYIVSFRNMFEEKLKTVETKDTFLLLNLSELGPKLKSFILTVEAKEPLQKPMTETVGKHVQLVEGQKAEELNKELKLVKTEAGEGSALSQLILAVFYEQNNLFLEAAAHYEKAILLEPGVEDYTNAYHYFMRRHVEDYPRKEKK